MFHILRASVLLISAFLLSPLGVNTAAASEDGDDPIDIGAPLPADCITAVASGYVDLVGGIFPAKGNEAYGQLTGNFGGTVLSGNVVFNILTFPKFNRDGSFSVRARFDDFFSETDKWTMIYDAKFFPTSTPGVYTGKAKGMFAGGEGLLKDMYYGATQAELAFAGNRLTMIRTMGPFCGVLNL